MKLEKGFLRNKVAKRVVWLLLLSALTPIIATTIVSFTYVTNLLTEEANAQLQRASKLYGMSLFDKLLLVEDKLKFTASLIKTGQDKGEDVADTPYLKDSDSRILLRKDKLLDSIYIDIKPSDNSLLDEFKGDNRPFLYTITRPDGATKTYMQLLLDIKNNKASSIVAEINNDYLWGKKDRLPFSAFLCVIEGNDKVIFCSEPVADEFIHELNSISRSSGVKNFKWNRLGEQHLAVAWEFFVKSRYNAPRWRIISGKQERAALLPVTSFNRVFPLIIVLSLLIVLLLSIVQVRKSMVPLEKLILGTKQILNKEYGKPIKVDSNDEFGLLTDAYNTMTIQLGKQINALTILSDIDHLILSNPALDKVLATLLDKAGEIIPCDLIAITLFNNQNNNTGITYISDKSGKAEPVTVPTEIPEDELNYLVRHKEIITIDLSAESWTFLEYLSGKSLTFANVLPVFHEQKPRAYFTLAYSADISQSDKELDYVYDIVDRFAVALATADRDEKLYNQAHYDSLTGLPNRQLMHDRLEQNILHSQRKQNMVGLLYIDIDRFKYINDSLGHSVGDKLLKHIATRMKKCVRTEDTVSRLGGDEFIIILPNISNSKDVGHIAENIVRTISAPVMIDSREIAITPSIGITLYPIDGLNNEELLKNADSAMYRAKERGRGKYVFFEERMNVEDLERIEIERDLREALQNQELELLYQPQVDMKSGLTTGVEVLVRWNHSERGVVSPKHFITIAEDTGLIEPIGEWILSTACHQFSEWQQQDINLEYIAVNVSGRQFVQSDFLDIIRHTLATTNIQPQHLELEITESVLMSDQVDAHNLFDELNSLGVKIAIDDFGTGYSSLSYLQRFPVSTLKIDRSFTSDIPANQDTSTIIYSIITLAHALDMKVVAEGIETKEQSEILTSQNCNIGQGYYFSKPLTREKMTEYLLQTDRSSNVSRS